MPFLHSGLIIRIPIWDQPTAEETFDDSDFWEMPNQGVPTEVLVDEKDYAKNGNTKM
jgi:hypothetical protein